MLGNHNLDLLLNAFLVHEHVGILGVVLVDLHVSDADASLHYSSEAVFLHIAEGVLLNLRVVELQPLVFVSLQPLRVLLALLTPADVDVGDVVTSLGGAHVDHHSH